MYTRDLPMDRCRALILIAVLCFAGATSLAAQQSPDQAGAAGASTAEARAPSAAVAATNEPAASVAQPSTSEASTARTTEAGPRVAPRFESYEPSMPGTSAETRTNASRGQHTIVISTLVLVLAVIIIVLLIVH